jgi:GTP-binding protein Era
VTDPTPGFRSGFVSLVGRPNVGKSTLVNRLVGTKVAIVSDRPQTTRTQIRGVRTTATSQLVLLDTPGIHKPRTLLGERTNERARSTLAEVDVICLLIEATGSIGPGDRYIAGLVQQVETPKILVVSKVDAADRGMVGERLAGAAAILGDFDAYVPLSGLTGEGVDALVGELEARLPEGPEYYPGGVVSDQPETFLVAELVREKLLRVAREELPHSITVIAEVEEPETGDDGQMEEPETGDDGQPDAADDDATAPRDDILRYRVRILVERDSQKGMVIGKGGAVLKEAGTLARRELEALLGARVHLATQVKVEKDWQRRAHSLDRLGF